VHLQSQQAKPAEGMAAARKDDWLDEQGQANCAFESLVRLCLVAFEARRRTEEEHGRAGCATGRRGWLYPAVHLVMDGPGRAETAGFAPSAFVPVPARGPRVFLLDFVLFEGNF